MSNCETSKGFTIAWQNLSVFVNIKNGGFFDISTGSWKKLVDCATGIAEPGEFVVLMGPSGAGKSTLMEALACRSQGNIRLDGDIRINGEPITKDFHRVSGFVHQEDLFVETLTVREHLEFTVRMKLSKNLNDRDVQRIVNKYLMEMNLNKCANVRIGNIGRENGISGGERKRLAFAAAVLTEPAILFCDEPTTGLDSFSAIFVIKLLKEMCARGKTVMCTVHQPSSELFAIFNQLIFITEGRTAFVGNKTEALEFFLHQGYACPDDNNPAEVIMRILSARVDGDDDKIKEICDNFWASDKAAKLKGKITRIMEMNRSTTIQDDRGFINSTTRERRYFDFKKVYWLTWRSFLQVVRDPSVQTIRILQKMGIALMASFCFFGNVKLNQIGIQSVQGAIFVLVTENTFPPMYGILSTFSDEFPIFLREQKANLYSIHSYYIAKIISLLPGLIIEPISFVLIAYFVIGFKSTFYAFFMTNLIVILNANVASACGSFFVNALGSVPLVLSILVPLDYVLMVTSGLFVKLSSLPAFIGWFRYLSWFLYANEALTIVQWENIGNITCEFRNPDVPCLKNGREVLQRFDFSEEDFWADLIALGTMCWTLHFLAYLFLCRRTRKNL